MGDNWDDIKVGHYVRLVGHGEKHELTVVASSGAWIRSKTGTDFGDIEGWSVEILQPPLPEEPGLYVTPEYQDGRDEGLWMLSAYGVWWQTATSGVWGAAVPKSDVPRDLVRLVKETQA